MALKPETRCIPQVATLTRTQKQTERGPLLGGKPASADATLGKWGMYRMRGFVLSGLIRGVIRTQRDMHKCQSTK